MKWPEDGSIWRDPVALVWIVIGIAGLVWTFVGAAMWLLG